MIVPQSKAIYIAGPMQGYKDFNFPAFFAAAKLWENREYIVGNPAQKDIDTYGENMFPSQTGDLQEAIKRGFCLRFALKWDLSWIAQYATAIYMLNGWENSKGARAEHALAVALGLDIFYQ